MTDLELTALILKHYHPEMAEVPGMVYQVWEDGEITLTKSGDLLGQRSLHCINQGYDYQIPLSCFPGDNNGYDHASIYTDREGAETVRLAILKERLEDAKLDILLAEG